MPRAGLGSDLADRHAGGIDSYDLYCARASQFVAVDVEAAALAYQRLVSDAALRRQMGAAARQRAQTEFDWSVIIPRYQALWQALADRRRHDAESAAPAAGAAVYPARMDPYRAFASYPSQVLGGAHQVALAPGANAARLQALLRMPLFGYMQGLAPDAERCAALFGELQRRGPLRVDALLATLPAAQHDATERALAWLAKLGQLRIDPPVPGVG
jgi:hypothetical protein